MQAASALIVSRMRPNMTNCCARRRVSIRECNGKLGARRQIAWMTRRRCSGVIMRDSTRAMQMGPIVGHATFLKLSGCLFPHKLENGAYRLRQTLRLGLDG